MHGLIFVTWEKFLVERFGPALLTTYRTAIGETPLSAPLASRVYDDATLLLGVNTACKLTGVPPGSLLREYGRYFIMNGLTSHLCAYLLTRVHNGRELLLTMRDAHAQMRRTPDNITPPLFAYEAVSTNPQELAIIYDSPRKLCDVLYGAIEGAAERFGEHVAIVERTCMKKGAHACRFDLRFTPVAGNAQIDTPEMQLRRRHQQQLADLVLTILPDHDGVNLSELQLLLRHRALPQGQMRLRNLLEALRQLQYAGLVSSTANQLGDNLSDRRYWRAPLNDQISTSSIRRL